MKTTKLLSVILLGFFFLILFSCEKQKDDTQLEVRVYYIYFGDEYIVRNATVSISQDNKVIQNRITDEHGEVIFTDLENYTDKKVSVYCKYEKQSLVGSGTVTLTKEKLTSVKLQIK